MSDYFKMSKQELEAEFALVAGEYERFRSMHLSLDMSRGKPGFDSMDVSQQMFDSVGNHIGFKNIDGIDCRNYGGLDGLVELKNLFSEILELEPDQIIVGGNSSLNMMFDTISQGVTHGLGGEPWGKQEGLKFLCPVPGYDRHFAITEYFGFRLVSVPMTAEGPDMETVERLIADPAVKGMWNVPKYSNPEGVTYSDETIRRIASMKPAAPDFMLMWDNAYCIHEFEGEFVPFADIIALCESFGNGDMVYEFASTSKVTFPGAGVGVMAASRANIDYLTKLIGIQTIGFDKINQLRHVRYLKDKATTLALMRRHAAVLAPKFRAVLDALDREIAPLGIAAYKRPTGGYFVSLDAMPGTAKRALALCKEAGVVMTGAGATYPYGVDPNDSNIRIAPTLPPVAELEAAIAVLCNCLRMAALEKLGV